MMETSESQDIVSLFPVNSYVAAGISRDSESDENSGIHGRWEELDGQIIDLKKLTTGKEFKILIKFIGIV